MCFGKISFQLFKFDTVIPASRLFHSAIKGVGSFAKLFWLYDESKESLGFYVALLEEAFVSA